MKSRVEHDFVSETFTTSGIGKVVDCREFPLTYFSIQVTQTGTVTSWTVLVEGSLDGITYSTILTHTKSGTGNGETLFSGALISLSRYVRANCSALNLGSGTNIKSTWIGMQ